MAPAVLHEGFMLKKKRKRVQGFAKRYFWLYENGALSYAFGPDLPVRESVMVTYAFVHGSRKTRSITIDSGVSVMHCKALNNDDFETWTRLLQPFSDAQGSTAASRNLAPTAEVDTSAAQAVPPAEHALVLVDQLGSSLGQTSVDQQRVMLGEIRTALIQLQQLDVDPNPGYASRSVLGPARPNAIGIANGRRRSSASQHVPFIRTGPMMPDTPVRGAGTVAGAGSAAAGAAEVATPTSTEADPRRFTVDDDDGEDDEERDSDEEAQLARQKMAKTHAVGGLPLAEVLNKQPQSVERRAQLPHPIAGDEFSMLAVLRKNVGKDLTTISFPVTFNEPLSALQRLTEEIEYSSLLDKAAASEDILDKLLYVATWATTGVSSNKYRTSRKPFNPLLYETYESIRPDKGYVFISEKVSHHPVVLAFYAEGRHWSYSGHLSPSQKFWGRSFEVISDGSFVVTLGSQDQFFISRPSSFLKNLISGQKYLEVTGELAVVHRQSNAKAIVNFKEGTTFGGPASRNHVHGQVFDAEGAVQREFTGKWDEALKTGSTTLWTIAPFPPNAQQYYGFTSFDVEMNEVTAIEQGQLAPTDSRLRPDQKALELGKVDDAEALKKQLEEKQREARKSELPPPAWFSRDGDEWRYNGKYFAHRGGHDWSNVQDIYI